MRLSHFLPLVGLMTVSLDAQSTMPNVARVIPTQTLAPAGASLSLNLADYFTVPGVTGQIVQFDTVLGKFDVELRADAAPRQVANFLNYVRSGRYHNSFFHRSASLDASGAIAIVQGGGYVSSGSGEFPITPDAAVPLEYNLPNERGTLAAARTSDPNSATSQWYFNVRDNTSILGAANGGGYTVFGRVLGTGMTVVDAMAALPRVDASGGDPTSPFQELPVRNYTSGSLAAANLVIVNSITPVALFPDSVSPGLFTFSAQSSSTNVVTASVVGSTLTLAPASAGDATVTVTGTDVNGNAVSTVITVSVASVAPAITTQPVSQTVAMTDTVVLSATATAADTYQWQHNGVDVAGAVHATLLLRNVTSADAGAYTLIARNGTGAATSQAATVTVTTPAPADVGRLVNLSIRSGAGVGDQTLIVGFSLGGAGTSGSAPLLLRAMGPSLAPFGLTTFLPDPVATMYNGTTVVTANDNWGGDPAIEARRVQVGAFGFASSASLDAALAIAPAAGTYTMQVTGNGTSSGTALAEIYDATAAGSYTVTTPRLVNISARTQVGTGDNVLIAGFVIRGTTAKTVLIRASGPALQRFSVGGTMTDPKLQLYVRGNTTPIAENDNWQGDPEVTAAASSAGAFPFIDGSSKDSALLMTLPPGNYSAEVTGADGGTGVALVEVYEVQ